MHDWNILLPDWVARYGCKIRRPATAEVLVQTISSLGNVPDELADLYKHSNGLVLDWFALFPLEDPTDIKNTWDGIKRANNPEKSRFLGNDPELFERFLVFASLDANACAAYDRLSKQIWYKEQDELVETDFSLPDFIEAALREVSEI